MFIIGLFLSLFTIPSFSDLNTIESWCFAISIGRWKKPIKLVTIELGKIASMSWFDQCQLTQKTTKSLFISAAWETEKSTFFQVQARRSVPAAQEDGRVRGKPAPGGQLWRQADGAVRSKPLTALPRVDRVTDFTNGLVGPSVPLKWTLAFAHQAKIVSSLFKADLQRAAFAGLSGLWTSLGYYVN